MSTRDICIEPSGCYYKSGFWKISFGEFLSISFPLKPRYYSISSSSKIHPNKVHITVGVVEGKSPTGRMHYGACSKFLSIVKPGTEISMFIRDTKANFRLPADTSKPVIMIGPGTGIAPMRGFIQERKATAASGETVLFFGCRNELDFLYQKELEEYKADKTLSIFEVAFSRKQLEKVYVQHKLLEKSKEIYELLEKGAHIYVCGDAKVMAPDVRKSFIEIIQNVGHTDFSTAENYIAHLCHSHRYSEDVWAS